MKKPSEQGLEAQDQNHSAKGAGLKGGIIQDGAVARAIERTGWIDVGEGI